MTNEERREYNRQKQREWRAKNPERNKENARRARLRYMLRFAERHPDLLEEIERDRHNA